MDNDLMKVLLVNPHEKPIVVEIKNTLEAEQQLVQGLIEVCYIKDDENVCLICNEEGKLIGMEANRRTDAGIICGPFFICGLSEENFRGLTDDEIKKYMKVFETPENIPAEDVEAELKSGFRFTF